MTCLKIYLKILNYSKNDGTLCTPNLLAVAAPEVALFTLATFTLDLILAATASHRAPKR